MGAEIEKAIPGTSITLIPGGRGDLIVKRGDELIWDKKGMGNSWPETDELIARLAE